MKTENDDSFEEIGTLLRSSHAPAVGPSPGLEGKILRELEARRRHTSAWRWSWLIVPATAIAAVVVLLSNPQPAAAKRTAQPQLGVVKVSLPVIPVGPAEAAHGIFQNNPLRDETLALQRDANRAEDFLFECLPTVGHAE